MTNYLLDTNILIDFVGPKKSATFFAKHLASDTQLGTSVVCITEFLVRATKAEEYSIIGLVEAGELVIHYFDDLNLSRATAALRRDHKIKLPDALILATALETGSHLLTGDLDLLTKARKIVPAKNPLL